MQNDNLKGRVAIVTGSGRNIGRSAALALAQRGASVIVNGHSDRAAVDAVVGEIRSAGGNATGVMADVAKHDDAARLIGEAVSIYGSADILVSNVGIRRYRAFLEITPEEWDEVLRTNLTAAFYLTRNAIPHMQKASWGRIILVSGFDGFWGQVTHRAPNVAAKAGLHGLAKALAREFGADNITANTVVPGAIDTNRDWSQYPHQEKERIQNEIPCKRFGDPDEVGAAIAFLATPGAGFISGQATHVNGGHYMF
ncbi:MAG: 3-oxoacyl-ACP reductase FabG [Pseudolabrys sp.]|nr:3-oxoacyl-ACP reductase FabG [Pseudolabrys sp.]